MEYFKSFATRLYEVNAHSFDDIALELFQYQADNNPVYSQFLQYLKTDKTKIKEIEEIPFLPVSFFKTHAIQTGIWHPEIVFTSSGTTEATRSSHLVHNLAFYHEHSKKCFEYFFGPLTDFHFLALLPSYLERSGSSLVSMISFFIEKSASTESGFYLNEQEELLRKIDSLRNGPRKVILWGVTFALLDMAERFSVDLSHCLVFETGGMKGMRKEITRFEFHDILKDRLNVTHIHSEYGMTELLSQAYTNQTTFFENPPYLKVLGRDISDPMNKGVCNETAALNVIDLANFHSISFIETADLGKVYQNGSFEVLGRMDNSDIRGCNLML